MGNNTIEKQNNCTNCKYFEQSECDTDADGVAGFCLLTYFPFLVNKFNDCDEWEPTR